MSQNQFTRRPFSPRAASGCTQHSPVCGVVFDPTNRELFTAERGAGARLNGAPIHVSKASRIEDALFSTGFPSRKRHNNVNIHFYYQLAMLSHGVRRGGSAAIDLAYTACGRLEGWASQDKPTDIGIEAGSSFELFGGYIAGRQLELVPNQRIVQSWRAGNWDPVAYSIARFDLLEQGSGTRIAFDHTGFPKGSGEHLASGWKEHYWEPLQKFLS